MSDLLHALRFFRVVAPVPRMMVVSTVVVGLASAMVLLADPRRGPDALVPLLALQVFAASAGFASAARRGHYDFILTRGVGRLSVALAHWLTSIAPGVVAWLALAALESLRSGHPATIVNSGSVAAIWMVSTIPWAATVALPRFSGAIGWTLLALMASVLLGIGGDRPWRDSGTSGWPGSWASVLWPSQLAGRDASFYPLPAVSGVCLSVLAMCAAFIWICRADVRLEAGQ